MRKEIAKYTKIKSQKCPFLWLLQFHSVISLLSLIGSDISNVVNKSHCMFRSANIIIINNSAVSSYCYVFIGARG